MHLDAATYISVYRHWSGHTVTFFLPLPSPSPSSFSPSSPKKKAPWNPARNIYLGKDVSYNRNWWCISALKYDIWDSGSNNFNDFPDKWLNKMLHGWWMTSQCKLLLLLLLFKYSGEEKKKKKGAFVICLFSLNIRETCPPCPIGTDVHDQFSHYKIRTAVVQYLQLPNTSLLLLQ